MKLIRLRVQYVEPCVMQVQSMQQLETSQKCK